jgi:hypothetical protein
MSSFDESDMQAFEEDLQILIDTLKQSFESEQVRHYLDEPRQLLFIEIEGLEEFQDDEIAEIAEPIFSELDLDFVEIALLPLRD